jgi:hypothetical protein
VTYPTLEHVAMEARPYPTHVLEGCETGLVLFAAGFLGHNDAIHFAQAGIKAICVDIAEERLEEMRALYPDTWRFFIGDAWDVARDIQAEGHQVDIVSCDTWKGDLMRRSLESLPLWCSLAKRAMTATLTEGAPYAVPDGWRDSLYERAYGVYWLVLERE